MESEILQSPIISYQSLLFIATAMNDISGSYIVYIKFSTIITIIIATYVWKYLH